jgi:hypothetical protein
MIFVLSFLLKIYSTGNAAEIKIILANLEITRFNVRYYFGESF